MDPSYIPIDKRRTVHRSMDNGSHRRWCNGTCTGNDKQLLIESINSSPGSYTAIFDIGGFTNLQTHFIISLSVFHHPCGSPSSIHTRTVCLSHTHTISVVTVLSQRDRIDAYTRTHSQQINNWHWIVCMALFQEWSHRCTHTHTPFLSLTHTHSQLKC